MREVGQAKLLFSTALGSIPSNYGSQPGQAGKKLLASGYLYCR